MNIITKTYGCKFHYIRPDISNNKDCQDYFCPEDITEFAAVPFIYIRIDKAGKAIDCKFAQRYYSTIGYGIHLVATSLIQPDDPSSWWIANSLDNATYFSTLSPIDEAQNIITTLLSWDNECLADRTVQQLISLINISIKEVSRYSSLKTGDYIVVELPYAKTYTTSTTEQSKKSIKLGEINFAII